MRRRNSQVFAILAIVMSILAVGVGAASAQGMASRFRKPITPRQPKPSPRDYMEPR
jgi:hypothetical protein